MIDLKLVDLDIERIRRHLEATFARPVTELEVHVWLRNAGFAPFNQNWVGDLRALPERGAEVIRASDVQLALVTVAAPAPRPIAHLQ